MSKLAAPMKMVDTSPSAAIAPSAARAGPMQQATQATAAMPRTDLVPRPDDSCRRWCRSRRRAEQIGDHLGGQLGGAHLQRDAGGVDGEGEVEERAAALLGADQPAEYTEVDVGTELDP